MRLEETLEYRCYLCLARICGTLRGDNLGSDGDYDDSGYYEAHITELFGPDIDNVFHSQHVVGKFGSKRWAFTDPTNAFKGNDLEARLFHDRDHDVYHLVNRPTQTSVDSINNVLTVIGAGVPDKFTQAAQLIELVKPEFRDRIVLSGLSLGGALSAYAAVKASWPVRTILFDPLGLNRNMMGRRGFGPFGHVEVLSDRFRSLDDFVDWYYIANSWVAKINVERHLSSVGRVTELPQDSVRATNNSDTHDFRHVRFGLHQLWDEGGWRGSRTVRDQNPGEGGWQGDQEAEGGKKEVVRGIWMEQAPSSGLTPGHFIMSVVKGTALEPLTTPEGTIVPRFNKWVWAYPDVPAEVWANEIRPVIQHRIEALEKDLKILEGGCS